MGLFNRKKKEEEEKEVTKNDKVKDAPKKAETVSEKKDSSTGSGQVNKEKAKPKKKTVVKRKVSKKDDNRAYKILIKPVISEKASVIQEENKYAFIVNKDSNRRQIANAVEDLYGVQVVQVRIVNVKGKMRRYGRSKGFTSRYKKAYVKLIAGDKLDLVEGV
ncbi:MAG: 50S ribosomal protein L23 [bacterium]